MSDERMERAQQQFDGFLERFRSVVLSTVDEHGRPASSYVPFVVDDVGRIHGFVSTIAAHTGHLERTGCASVFFIEDEADAEEIFARKRLTHDCDAVLLERDHPDVPDLVDRFKERFGPTGEMITGMADFRPVRLTPRSGRFVIGFGAAYAVEGSTLTHLRGGGAAGGGHGHGHGGSGHADAERRESGQGSVGTNVS